jgi:hypothetical protein
MRRVWRKKKKKFRSRNSEVEAAVRGKEICWGGCGQKIWRNRIIFRVLCVSWTI